MTGAAGYVWRYLPGRIFRHLLPVDHTPTTPALCGAAPPWYRASTGIRWIRDEAKVAERRPCGRCAAIVTSTPEK